MKKYFPHSYVFLIFYKTVDYTALRSHHLFVIFLVLSFEQQWRSPIFSTLNWQTVGAFIEPAPFLIGAFQKNRYASLKICNFITQCPYASYKNI